MRPLTNALLCLVIGVPIFFGVRATNAATSIRLMSFNIKADFNFGAASSNDHAWIDSSGDHRRDFVTQTIQQYSPDILGVQEAFINQMNDLTNALPGYTRYGVGRNDGLTFGEHSGIFYRSTRFARANQGTFWLSLTPDQPSVHPNAGTFRIATWAILQDSQNENEEYFVLNSHWATGFNGTAAREYSAQQIRDRINQLAGERPVIVMGDLNAFEFQPAIKTLLGEGDPEGMQLLDSYRQMFPKQGANERTNHGWSGNIAGQRIDYLMHSNDFRTETANIVHTNFDGNYPSDHYPITATLAIVPELLGDFNEDGSVDAADYTVWRDQFGQSGTGLIADADGNLVVDEVDYEIWRDNYGSQQSAANSVTVPEPSTRLLVQFAWMVALMKKSSREV